MPKIKKKKKSGMLRRQKQKRHNKMIRRHKSMPKRKPQLQNSTQLEQLLNALPTLAFEPELADLSMDQDRLKELMKNDRKEPDMLLDLLSEEFVSELDQRLAMLEESYSDKSIKSALAKATRHQLSDNNKINHLSNPVIVSIFLKSRSVLEGRELDLVGLQGAMKEFEQNNHEYINLLAEQIQKDEIDKMGSIAAEDSHEEEVVDKMISPLQEAVYKKFIDLLPAERQERTEEDLEVFLIDFQPPNLKDWDTGMVKHFFGEWFLENANPLKEDLDSMRMTLLSLFKFLDGEELLPKGVHEKVSAFLEKSK